MASSRAAHFRYFVAPQGQGTAGDGTPDRPLGSVQEALRGIAERHGGEKPSVKRLQGQDRVDICSIARTSGGRSKCKRPRYAFYVDPLGAGDQRGAGTALSPWPDLESALSGVAQLDRQGELRLAPGEHLSLTVREVFSATPVDRQRRRYERIAQGVFFVMTMALVVPLFLILGHLVVKAWPVLSVSFIFENPRNSMTAGGIWAPLVGTFYLVFISLLAATPIGILAGVPSIVHALFGVGAFVMFAGMGKSVLAASCTLAIMTLPVIISSTKEALASVPMTFREACWNMGASRWQTIRTIVLPNSISGILTGVILQVSRAAGETAPILFTGAAFFMNVPNKGLRYFFPYSLNDSCMALSYHLHVMLTQVKGATAEQIAAGDGIPLEQLQYGTAVVLIGLVLLVNSASIGLRVYLRSRKKW